MAVINPETKGFTACLRVSKCIDYLARLREVATNAADYFKQIIFWELIITEPESNIFIASWVPAVRFELCYLVSFKLVYEARICRPELPNIVYVE